jgi:hypothetical protein
MSPPAGGRDFLLSQNNCTKCNCFVKKEKSTLLPPANPAITVRKHPMCESIA